MSALRRLRSKGCVSKRKYEQWVLPLHSRRDDGVSGFSVQLCRWHKAARSRTEPSAGAAGLFRTQPSCRALGDMVGRYQLLVWLKPTARLAQQLAE